MKMKGESTYEDEEALHLCISLIVFYFYFYFILLINSIDVALSIAPQLRMATVIEELLFQIYEQVWLKPIKALNPLNKKSSYIHFYHSY